jgi:hypothetical protein
VNRDRADTAIKEVPMAITSISDRPSFDRPSFDRSSTTGPSSAGSGDARLEIDHTRARQTARAAPPFRSVLSGGVSLLMSGAEVATHVIAGPVLAAAVHDARAGAVAAVAAGGAPGAAGTGTGAAAGGTPDAAGLESMLQSGQASNLQLLALQEEVQQESQRFSTISNVMRARYDTAKAAVSNIRA